MYAILPFCIAAVNMSLLRNCQLLCALAVRSLLLLTLSEPTAELLCTKRCLKNLKYKGKKELLPDHHGPAGANFVEITEKTGIFAQ